MGLKEKREPRLLLKMMKSLMRDRPCWLTNMNSRDYGEQMLFRHVFRKIVADAMAPIRFFWSPSSTNYSLISSVCKV